MVASNPSVQPGGLVKTIKIPCLLWLLASRPAGWVAAGRALLETGALQEEPSEAAAARLKVLQSHRKQRAKNRDAGHLTSALSSSHFLGNLVCSSMMPGLYRSEHMPALATRGARLTL